MGRAILRFTLPLLFVCLVFTGCGSGPDPMQQALDLRAALLNAGGCRFSCDVTADLGDSVSAFTLDCSYTPETGTAVTVSAPAEIAGLTAQVAADGVTVQFGETLLDFGDLAAGNISALTAPALAAGSWAGDYIRDAGREDQLLRFTCLHNADGQELEISTWLDAQGLPSRCEISADGTLILTAVLRDYQTGT